ncbi:S-layer homology domain-containing protein [Halobacillus seohaensis]|uniref:S-layer homology domain-containing protein n=1 Tax=Halobacillus seohaensis TaxID=447421 RepID=A0ABW2ELB1_9BACI
MKNIMLTLLGFSLIFSLFTPVASAEDDITGTDFEEEMKSLIEKEIMEGYDDGTYKPKNSVTRAEFTAFLVRALDIELKEDQYPDKEFNDVNSNDWFHKYVLPAYNQGIINGFPSGDFKPNDVISRQDMAVMMANTADSEGLVSERLPLDFTDNDQIDDYAKEAVERLTYLRIINGKKLSDDSVKFAPDDKTSRGETAAVITRLLDQLNPSENLNFSVVSLDANADHDTKGEFKTYDEAVSRTTGNDVVLEGNNVVWINEGIAISNKFTILYKSESLATDSTYVTSGVEMELLEIDEDWVKIKLADTTGFVDPDKVNLTPTHMIEDRSHYEVEDGDLVHKINNSISGISTGYTYGAAPDFMKEGEEYYSWNGNTFYNEDDEEVGEAYQYFNRMPLYSKTDYTAEQLDQYVEFVESDSPLIGTGESFKKAEEEHGTNALYLLAHAIHESNWGQSKIAKDKNNLFGIGAVDSNPYENAEEFDDLESGILGAAEDFIGPGYFASNGPHHFGAHLGNKSSGMNVKYASDAYWGQKIAGHMYRADQYLSKKYDSKEENARNDLAKTVTTNVNVRPEANTNKAPLYQLPKETVTVEILDTIEANGTWYEVIPKNILDDDYKESFIYSHGYSPYGTSLEKLPTAK